MKWKIIFRWIALATSLATLIVGVRIIDYGLKHLHTTIQEYKAKVWADTAMSRKIAETEDPGPLKFDVWAAKEVGKPVDKDSVVNNRLAQLRAVLDQRQPITPPGDKNTIIDTYFLNLEHHVFWSFITYCVFFTLLAAFLPWGFYWFGFYLVRRSRKPDQGSTP